MVELANQFLLHQPVSRTQPIHKARVERRRDSATNLMGCVRDATSVETQSPRYPTNQFKVIEAANKSLADILGADEESSE